MRRVTNIVGVSTGILLLHGCGAGRVEMSSATQQSLANQKGTVAGDSLKFMNSADVVNTSNASSPSNAANASNASCADPNRQRCLDYTAETEISNQSLRAWRLELADKTDEAMSALEGLDKKYPNIKTVYMMKGQVQQHAGHKEEALKYYQKSIVGNEFDSTELFKAAELERDLGKTERAVEHYRKLLEVSPTFTAGRLGLAKALLEQDPQSAEAKEFLQKIVAEDPDGKDKLAQDAASILKKCDAKTKSSQAPQTKG
jgi:tetratricopeptide (TPR) repeat protein